MSILDKLRSLQTRRQKPDTGKVAVAPLYSKFSTYPSHGLTPERLAAIFREADEGEVYRQMELFEEMEEHDPHLYAQLQTRKNAVTGLDWEVSPFSGDPQDEQIADFVREQLHSIKNLEDVMLDLMDAIGKGIAISEIQWQYDEGRVVVGGIEQVHPKLLRWDQEDVMRLVTKDEPLGVEIPLNKFIVHKYKAKSGHPSRAGILRVCAWMYLFKNYTIKDWISFMEVFGLPLRLGKYANGASDDDKAALWEALVKMGTDAAGMVPESSSIEFVNTSSGTGSANGIYETMARYCDEQISKAILGQTLTSDSGKGSYAQSKTHNEVRHDLTVADCKALAATLRDDLIYPLVLFNFGVDAAKRLPQIDFDCEESDDLQALAEILQTLAGMNVPIPLQYIYKKFSIPEPAKGAAVTKSSSYPLPLKLQANKADGLPDNNLHRQAMEYQRRADRITDAALAQSPELFAEMFAPVKALADRAGSLQELRDLLDDPKETEKLLDASVSDNLTELLANSMFAADLAGRLKAHGQ